MRRERLERELDRLFTERLTRPRFLNQIVKGVQKAPQANIRKLNDQLVNLESKRNRILDAYFDNLIDPAERDRRTAEVDKERGILSTMITKQKPRPEIDVQTLSELFSVFAEFDMLDREEKRGLLNTITPSITVANYEIAGMWIGIDRSDDLIHSGKGSSPQPA
jgi:hypothetical protein